MIRTSKLILKNSNTGKLDNLRFFIQEYQKLVNFYIQKLWEKQIFIGTFINKELQNSATTWLSARIQQCAGKQAIQMVKPQRKRKRKTCPEFKNVSIELDSRFVTMIQPDSLEFDSFVRFGSLGKRLKILCPVRFHKHFLKYKIDKKWKQKQSIRLSEYNGNLYINIFFEKDFESTNSKKFIGLDVGLKKLIADSDGNFYGQKLESYINKIQRKQRNSKAFQRALVERNHFINKTIKELPKVNFVVENLKNVKKNCKKNKRLRKIFRSRIQYWIYSKILSRIRLYSEVVGVQCLNINPAYTSQTCSFCGFKHKGNRQGEVFKCKRCRSVFDADYNAAKNILFRCQEFIVPDSGKINDVNICI